MVDAQGCLVAVMAVLSEPHRYLLRLKQRQKLCIRKFSAGHRRPLILRMHCPKLVREELCGTTQLQLAYT